MVKPVPDISPTEPALYLLKTKLWTDRPTKQQQLKAAASKRRKPASGDVHQFKTSGCHWQQTVFSQVLEMNISFSVLICPTALVPLSVQPTELKLKVVSFKFHCVMHRTKISPNIYGPNCISANK